MKSGTVRRCAVVLAAAAALGTAGGALACDGSGPSSARAEAMRTLQSHEQGGGLGKVVSNYLGLTESQIKAQLRKGKTLADIANATPGKSAAGLVDAIVAAVKAQLDKKVAAGKLSASKEADILSSVRTMATKIVNGKFAEDDGRHKGRHK